MRLKTYAKQQLSTASRSAISTAMGQLPIHGQGTPKWLASGHRYEAANIADLLRNDTKAGTIDDEALAQRIAASVPSHVLDGWSLFGRAVHCLIQGDTRSSVHLGYYAELRAVLAIVASEGIGIFNKQHFVIDEFGVAHRLRSDIQTSIEAGTHEVVWPVYSWWITQPTAHELITDVIRPGSTAIRDWFNNPNRDNIYLTPTAGAWLLDWGLDLRRMNKDRGARNASSYGPSALHGWATIDRAAAFEAMIDLWRTFEPFESSRFDEIDRLFLRRVLLVAFNGQTSRRRGSKGWHSDFDQFVDRFLDDHRDHHLVQVDRERWKRALLGTTPNNATTPLEYASKQSSMEAESFPIELLSRAGLLLRIASGSCSKHLVDVGATWDSLMFWLDEIGIQRGFWSPGLYPGDPIELWSDINDVLEAIDRGESIIGDGRSKLEEYERVGMWGLGI